MKEIKVALESDISDIAVGIESRVATKEYSKNTIGMPFVSIASGEFYMGTCKLSKEQEFMDEKCPSGGRSDKAKNLSRPQHRVVITSGFEIGSTEVTVEQFKEFIRDGGRSDLLTDEFIEANNYSEDAAVTSVSWDDIQAFVTWLTAKEPDGYEYRLPTEAEWEYAARAGTVSLYSWGDDEKLADRYAWFTENAYSAGESYAHEVALKLPNPWGLYDMHGNVHELVQDCWKHDYYRDSPIHDPKGPEDIDGKCRRVTRGGGWGYRVTGLTSVSRNALDQNQRSNATGFRLVRKR